jgi:hypothetical protein
VHKAIVTVSLLALLGTGCAQVPIGCAGCTDESKIAYAVARPSPCNDFPVSYRVNAPKERDRILAVDQVTKHLEPGQSWGSVGAACSQGQ